MATKKPKTGKKKNNWGVYFVTFLVLLVILAGAGVLAKLGWDQYLKDAEAAKVVQAHDKAREEREARIRALPAPPTTIVNGSAEETAKVAAKLGWAPCPGPCLKLATPIWRSQKVKHYDGFADSDWWFTFPLSGNREQSFSQRHVGHIIRVSADDAVDTGNCSICNGTGWVPKACTAAR